LPHDIQSTALRKLNNAKELQDLAVPPNHRLEALKGDRAGQHNIRTAGRMIALVLRRPYRPKDHTNAP